jgi:4-hydroxy-tetrahydrodipicolinate synthase
MKSSVVVPKLGGVVTALGTPLDAGENLHEEGMRRQIRMQLGAGVHGLLVAGSMGAMQLLKDTTFHQAIEVAADEVRGRVPLIAGCGDTSTERTLARIQIAERFELSGVALVPPFFYKFSQDELFTYFHELADASALPLYLYDNPVWTKIALEYSLIADLARHPNIFGLKASGEFFTFRLCAEEYRSSKDFVVLSGQTPFFDLALQLGGKGIVEGLFAIAPELGVAIWNGIQNSDFESARSAQQRLLRLVAVVKELPIFAAFTAAMNLRGIPGNFAMRPFPQVTPEISARIEKKLFEFGLLQETSPNS